MVPYKKAVTAALAAIGTFVASAAWGADEPGTATFAVLRNNDRIGINTVAVAREGSDTTVESRLHLAVKFAFLTVYRYDQVQTERWSNGHLLSLEATTDDNGTVHTTRASKTGDEFVVDDNGREKRIAASLFPLTLWTDAIASQSTVLNPETGKVEPLKVVDRGEDEFTVQGRPTRAHHYVLTTSFSQDVWYDESHRMVRLELKGRDGSTIRYQLV